MQFEEFSLERIQSLYENTVEFNLSDSGVHPYDLKTLLSQQEIDELCSVALGYGWTNGAVELREAIAALYQNRTADEVIVTNGSAEANFLMTSCLLEPGDEAVVIVPNYLQIFGWAKAIGAVVKTVSLKEELEWRPDMDEIRAAITSKTRLITICNPNNPTGALLTSEDMAELVAIAREHDLYLHADEVYKGSELNQDEPASFADLYEKAIVTNGMSKAMAMPGLRIGWLVGPAQKIYRTWQCKDYTSITTGALSEYITTLALEPSRRQQVLDRSKSILRKNLAALNDWVQQNPQFSLCPPKAGGMAFLRYQADINSTDLAHQLREQSNVLVLPGDVYGLDGYIRIGIGEPKAYLQAGLERLREFFQQLEPVA